MRARLDTWPEPKVGAHVQAIVDHSGGGGRAESVIDVPVDAVVIDEVARSKSIRVVCERSISNALIGTDTIAAKPIDGPQDSRLGERPGIKSFIPVPMSHVRGEFRLDTEVMGSLTVARPCIRTRFGAIARGRG
jgi:hypothetical protein